MNPRAVLLIALPLAAVLAFVLLDGSGDGEPAPLPSPELGAGDESLREDTPIDPVTGANEQERPTPQVGKQAESRTDVDLSDPENGLIDGRLQLGAEVLQRMTTYTVWIREQINERNSTASPFVKRRSFPVTLGGPQYFELADIPFSTYGYRVWVTAPNLNGSFQIIRLDPKNPVADVKLAVTMPAPFALRLIDQFNQPLSDRDVELYAIDETIGAVGTAKTNAYGTAVFDEMVAGDYEVVLDQLVRGTVRIDPPGFVRDPLQVRHASASLVIPIGATVRVELFDQIGRGIQDVEVQLDRVDVTDNRRAQVISDFAGIATFESVGPGTYQVNIRDRTFQPTSRRVQIRKSENVTEVVETLKIKLTLAR